jgi:3-hydroxy-9,10-secoandrosta-1,3,5(10)-triene-9,17-dione monooxygenase reductase component
MNDKQRRMRNALGRFATGVTVVTGSGADGTAVGVTISSFNTVSLEPPLVLWSLARQSKSLNCFAPGMAHTIHILSAQQQTLAERFASSTLNKFDGLSYRLNPTGVPILPDCLAYFECLTQSWYEGGDHIIIIAKVQQFEIAEGEPLLFYRGQFTGIKSEAK